MSIKTYITLSEKSKPRMYEAFYLLQRRFDFILKSFSFLSIKQR